MALLGRKHAEPCHFRSQVIPWWNTPRRTGEGQGSMSPMGQKRTFREVCTMSAIPPKADIGWAHWDIARWSEMKEAANW